MAIAAKSAGVWAVVVTYNGARWIEECLKTLQDQAPEGIVVVDNHSSDNTIGRVRKCFPSAVIVALPSNQGYGMGANRGISTAIDRGAELVFLLNQDVRIPPGSLESLVEEMSEHDTYALLSPLHLTYDGTAVEPGFTKFMPGNVLTDAVAGEEQPIYGCEFMPAAAVLLRRAALEEVGGFDPLFFLYGEDDDLCRRLIESGWKIGLVPRARVCHSHTGAALPSTLSARLNREYSRSVLYLKESRRSLPLAYAGLLKRCLRPGIAGPIGRIAVFLRCLLLSGRIARHRRDRPYEFRARDAAPR